MFNFGAARAAVQAEGVYIGGWSIKQALVANNAERTSTSNESVDKAQDRVEQVNTLIDWEVAEERALVRKLDLRVL
ncbi:hypothetical protein LTR27_008846 [Elasticomyces elasticus]|nr:hypothetical protein LTR27_008846 [Elasticomyces elasticus]